MISNYVSQPKDLNYFLLMVLDYDISLESSTEKTLKIFDSMKTENFILGNVNIRIFVLL